MNLSFFINFNLMPDFSYFEGRNWEPNSARLLWPHLRLYFWTIIYIAPLFIFYIGDSTAIKYFFLI